MNLGVALQGSELITIGIMQNFFGAFYLQDRIVFEGMTLNLGIRTDYWAPGRYVEEGDK